MASIRSPPVSAIRWSTHISNAFKMMLKTKATIKLKKRLIFQSRASNTIVLHFHNHHFKKKKKKIYEKSNFQSNKFSI